MKWEEDSARLPGQICMSLADEVESVPHHEILSFGGNADMMVQFTNIIKVIECGELKRAEPVVE